MEVPIVTLHAARQLPAWLISDVGQNSRARHAADGIWRKAKWVWRIYATSQSSAVGIAPLEEFDGLKEIRARAGRALRSLSPTTRGKAAAQKSE
jgi:hypothetical protein